MRLVDETGATFLRDVRQILRVEEIGLRVRDQLCEVITFEYSDARAPIDVAVSTTDAPLAVWCLDVVDTDRTLPGRMSGRTIDWSWRSGSVRVTDVDVPATANTYYVTVGILR